MHTHIQAQTYTHTSTEHKNIDEHMHISKTYLSKKLYEGFYTHIYKETYSQVVIKTGTCTIFHTYYKHILCSLQKHVCHAPGNTNRLSTTEINSESFKTVFTISNTFF